MASGLCICLPPSTSSPRAHRSPPKKNSAHTHAMSKSPNEKEDAARPASKKRKDKKKQKKKNKKRRIEKQKNWQATTAATTINERTVASVTNKEKVLSSSNAAALTHKKEEKTRAMQGTVVEEATSRESVSAGSRKKNKLSREQSAKRRKRQKLDTGIPATLTPQNENTTKNYEMSARTIRDISGRQNDERQQCRRPEYAFEVDDTDHCETPLQAYQDLRDVLDRLCKALQKTRTTVSIYDPYYCDGGVRTKLASMGYANVINRNRDFYYDIANGDTPDYDILITNPPYSGIHIEKLLTFCATSGKPFLLLLPHFVYTKDYYTRSLRQGQHASTSLLNSIFFLIPQTRYAYLPPKWVQSSNGSRALIKGKDRTAPFPSFWYCFATTTAAKDYRHRKQSAFLVGHDWLVQTFGPSGMVRPQHRSKLRYAKCTKDIPRDFKGEFDVTKKRPNPKARKRAAKKRRQLQSM